MKAFARVGPFYHWFFLMILQVESSGKLAYLLATPLMISEFMMMNEVDELSELE